MALIEHRRPCLALPNGAAADAHDSNGGFRLQLSIVARLTSMFLFSANNRYIRRGMTFH